MKTLYILLIAISGAVPYSSEHTPLEYKPRVEFSHSREGIASVNAYLEIDPGNHQTMVTPTWTINGVAETGAMNIISSKTKIRFQVFADPGSEIVLNVEATNTFGKTTAGPFCFETLCSP